MTIRSVTATEIRIGDERLERSVALTAEGTIDDWTDKPVDSLTEADFSNLMASQPELIVLGTGQAHVIPPRELVFAMARKGIGFEVMQTSAAARTFNVLTGEGRLVAAVLYL